MKSIIGNVKVVNLGSSSVLQFGNAIQISPLISSKTFAGVGSFITGDLANTNNAVSTTNTNDPDISDSSLNIIGNAGVI